jgi:hypothetical protein
MNHATMTNPQQSRSALQAAQWAMPAGEALRIDIGPGARELHVTQGRLWLTREGTAESPAEDLWLNAGEAIELASGSDWVIEGWAHDGQETRFQLLVPPQACATFARRIAASVRSSAAQRRFSFRPVPALG